MTATIYKSITGDYGYEHKLTPDLTGKTFVVTGGTNGIGLSLSRTLFTHGANLYILSSSDKIGKEGVAYIESGDIKLAPHDYAAGFEKLGFGSNVDTSGEGGQSKGTVEFIKVDLADLNAVAKTAKELKSRLKRIDVVANIAGKGVNAFELTKDGIDSHLTINVLSHHLLLSHLLPNLVKTSQIPDADVRIVNMSSEQHRGAPSDFDPEDMSDWSKELGPIRVYNRSKLGNLLFTKALVQRYLKPPSKVLAYATHPGGVATGQTDQYKEAYGEAAGTVISAAVRPVMRSIDQGSLSVLWASVAPEARSDKYENGTYFSDPAELGGETSQAQDQKLIDSFFDQSETIIKNIVGADNVGKWID